jgi:hypothetical protein
MSLSRSNRFPRLPGTGQESASIRLRDRSQQLHADAAISQEDIFKFFPTAVIPYGQSDPVPLEQWHDTVLKKICRAEIFPGVVSSLSYTAVRAFGAKMVDAPNDRVGGGLMSPADSGDWGTPAP